MTFEISVPPNGRYVLVRVIEPMTTRLALQIAEEATAFADSHDLTAFLYDLRQSRNTETDAKNYFFVRDDLQKAPVKRHARFALLTAPDDTSHDFIALVASNAGFLVRIFHDEAEAVDWLAGQRL